LLLPLSVNGETVEQITFQNFCVAEFFSKPNQILLVVNGCMRDGQWWLFFLQAVNCASVFIEKYTSMCILYSPKSGVRLLAFVIGISYWGM